MNVWLSPGISQQTLYRVGTRCFVAIAVFVPLATALWLAADHYQRIKAVPISGAALPETCATELETLHTTSSHVWSSLTRSQSEAYAPGGIVATWRLAGTFFSFPESGRSERKAVLDNVKENRQVLVSEGEKLDDMEIARIFSDHVVVRRAGNQEVLWLSFAPRHEAEKEGEASALEPAPQMSVMEKTKFGTRVGEHRWVMNRDALMTYYNELREDPERIAKLYVSMRPNYMEDGRIAGYRVDMVGEEDFFQAVGLVQGDIVKKVNSLEMTSQAKAEYFISEFLQGRLSAVVLDIERAGVPEKLIYFIR